MALTEKERERYSRQLMLDGWGEATQERLQASTVFIAGAGGLGSPVSIYLAVAGVGHLVVCDFDAPDLSNLNRQILHSDSRIGMNKAASAKLSLEALNPAIRVSAVAERITEANVDMLVGGAEVIVDCMDNFPTRYVLNAAAIRKGIPMIHAGVWGMEGQMMFIHVPETPCLCCVFSEAPPPARFPVVGVTPGVMGTLQAMETLKYLTGIGQNLKGELLIWDGSEMKFRTFRVAKDPSCSACCNAGM
jgi:adenylyltransferase/sulfurtransferase